MNKTVIGFLVVQKPVWGQLFQYSWALYCISWNYHFSKNQQMCFLEFGLILYFSGRYKELQFFKCMSSTPFFLLAIII